ncbi:DUF1800 domain-containing protein, partial [Burkholderia multivorans]
GDPQMLANTVRTLGQNLFYPPNVKGWPGGAMWINSTTLLARKQFVEQLFRATETAGMRTGVAANVPSPSPSRVGPSVAAAMTSGVAARPASPARGGLR